VLSPDGRPAANAEIGLVSPGARLSLQPGGFSRDNMQSGGNLLRVNNHGEFKLPADEAITRIIAADPAGYAEVSPAALVNDPTIHLEPWGRLEGIYFSDGREAAGSELLFQYDDGDFNSVSSDFAAYQVRTDRDGHFVFAQVPPGKHNLVRLVYQHGTQGGPDGLIWTQTPLLFVEIQPGQTTQVTVGNK
jgi:hypothetical protein